MAFAAEFHMPGAYFDPATPAATGQPLSATMFRPPMSPSASSSVYNLAKSTGSLYSDVSMATNTTPGVGAKRKRTRAEVSRASTPNADWHLHMDGACDPREEETPARQQQLDTASGREIRYTLAGQIDTPSGPPPHTSNGILEDSVYSDIDYRRALGSKRPHDDLDSPSTAFSGLRLETPNAAPVTPRQGGWSSLALSTIGGVVGKVWEFCKTGGFRGFQAGGGERYAIGTPSKGGQQWCNEHDVPTLDVDGDEHNVPGGFPQSEYVSLHELSTPDSTPRPAVKRRQTSATNGEELRRNWVIVDQPSPPAPASSPSQQQPLRPSTTFTKPSSARPSLSRPGPHAPRYSTPTTSSSSRRISVPKSRLAHNNNNNNTPSAATRTRNARNRISHAGSPALSSREPASYAAPRSPSSLSLSHNHNNQTPASPSRIPLPSNPANGSAPNPFAIPGTSSLSLLSRPSSRASLSRCASPAPLHHNSSSSSSHKRKASTASASGRSGGRRSAEGMVDSPRLTAEAKQLAAKKLAAERDADAKMEAFNRRLMDMIRQGKEALGTTVEVDMEPQGEGEVGFGMPTAGWEDDD